MEHGMSGAAELVERLAAAAGVLEQTAERMEARQSAMEGEVRRIVATVEQEPARGELERKLREAEEQIAELRAQGLEAGSRVGGRRTLASATASLLAKQGVSTLEAVDAGALDAAMSSLSLEQRIAVKSELFRAGLM